MRLESANIRVINRRHSYLDRDPCRFPRAGIKPKPRSVLTGRSISGTGAIAIGLTVLGGTVSSTKPWHKKTFITLGIVSFVIYVTIGINAFLFYPSNSS
jgi:hypothetical protein